MIEREDAFSIPIFTYDYEGGELKGIHVGNRLFVPASDKTSDGVENSNVTRPKHYISSDGPECIDAIKASMSSDEFAGYLRGNVMKYIWRFRKKGGVEDLEKARWYLDKLIEEERNAKA